MRDNGLMDGKVTMLDVAREAGVHVTTVSLALRNNSRIPDATRERIQRIASQLGYERNPLVSALMASRRRPGGRERMLKIAYASSFEGETGWITTDACLPDYFKGAACRAGQLGFALEHFDIGRARIGSQRFFDILKSRGIIGLVISPLTDAVNCATADLSDLCVVSLGRRNVLNGVHRVAVNQGQCIRLALQQCVKAGCRRVGLALLSKHRWEGAWEETIGSYLAWTLDRNFKGLAKLPPFLLNSAKAGEFLDWYGRARPEVIITNHPDRVRPWLAHGGIAIPADVGLITLGCNLWGSGEAGVTEDHEGVAIAAVELLISQIMKNESGPSSHPREVLLMGRWVAGESFREAAG